MKRKLAAVVAGLAVVTVPSLAHAQRAAGSFGDQGQFIVSADRLFPLLGYSHASETEIAPPAADKQATDSESYSNLGFFYGGTPGFTDPLANVNLPNGFSGVQVTNFYTVPRVGFDYTIIPNLTIGGDVILFFTLGGNVTHEDDFTNGGNQTNTRSTPTNTTFGIAPRVGYILHLSELFAFWLRGGLSFYTETVKQSVTNNGNQTTTLSANYDELALDLDPQLVITPLPHVGFTVGVTGDIPITGGHSYTASGGGASTSSSAGANFFFLGSTAGILVWF